MNLTDYGKYYLIVYRIEDQVYHEVAISRFESKTTNELLLTIPPEHVYVEIYKMYHGTITGIIIHKYNKSD